ITAVFQGLTVRNGLADAGGGGGIRAGMADLLVQDCVITGNRTAGEGGGISNAAQPGTGNVTLIRTTVDHNVATFGGGLRVNGDLSGDGSLLTINGSTIQRNIARDGGGIDAAMVNLNGSSIIGNIGTQDSGGLDAATA